MRMRASFRLGARSPAKPSAEWRIEPPAQSEGAEVSMVSRGVALYARVSTDQQARDNTIASQVAALHERIAAEDDRVLPEHIYIDLLWSQSKAVSASR
jgi:predicted site-specific integrase-resolvase